MEILNFKDIATKNKVESAIVDLGEGVQFEVSKYLPISHKGELITFVVNGAIDPNTGCFSPLRTEVFFTVGLVKWYTTIEFSEEELLNIGDTYDKLEVSGLVDKITDIIPEDELKFMQELVKDTTADITRYNNSFAGMMTAMSGEASSLDDQLTEILNKIKNKEGMELLSVIKEEMGGTN